MSSPCAAEIVPELLMPPVNVEPVMRIPVLVAVIVLAPSIRMPRPDARISPLSTIAPLMVLPAMAMAVLAVIVPELEILPPLKLETPVIWMPRVAAVITPALVMPPWKVETVLTRMPTALALMVAPPALTMPPENDETLMTAMPVFGSIRPALVMPPENPLIPDT